MCFFFSFRFPLSAALFFVVTFLSLLIMQHVTFQATYITGPFFPLTYSTLAFAVLHPFLLTSLFYPHLSFPCVYFVQHIFLSATSPLRPSFSFHCVSIDVHPFPYESWLLSQYHQLYKGGQTFFFPQAKNRFPIEAKGQETPPATIFKN